MRFLVSIEGKEGIEGKAEDVRLQIPWLHPLKRSCTPLPLSKARPCARHTPRSDCTFFSLSHTLDKVYNSKID